MTALSAAWSKSLLTGLVALAVGMGSVLPTAALADTAPLDPAAPTTPPTVSADALPTAQIDGVAWAQVVSGTTVYVAGRFGRVRPAGAAPGTQETVRNNLLAYDIRTGELISSFAPDLNAQALALSVSPDGSRLYVGGDFTVANGQPRSGVAAYDTATGQLVSTFRPAANSTVRAIAATNGTVYLGGEFSAVGSSARSRLAAVSAATGELLPWAPQPGTGSTAGNWVPNDPAANARTSNSVLAMVLAGDDQVVVAGRFDTLNGTKATGVGALDATSGATRPFAANRYITNQGAHSAVWSLSTDGADVYGTAYDFYGPGSLEGTFAARANGGAVRWFADCRGDTYSAFPVNGAVYTASHAHNCRNIGSFPETSPASYWHANAFSSAPYTVNANIDTGGRGVMAGQPAPNHLAWHPTFVAGTFTGQYQAGWTVTGNQDYVVYGGEFPSVNGRPQQGLVRFAVPRLAPNAVGPVRAGSSGPTATAVQGGMRLSFPAAWDKDNEHLTYRVHRDSTTGAPACVVTAPSRWWQLPTQACTDTGATAGSHRYLVSVSDAAGNRVDSAWTTVTVPVASSGTATRAYERLVAAHGAVDHWTLGESTGPTAFDHSGAADMGIGTGVTRGATGAVTGDRDTAFRFNGTSSGSLSATAPAAPAPQNFSVEAWFQTTTTRGGKIVGWGNARTGLSPNYDRHVYMDAQGRLHFGVYSGGMRILSTTAALNDGRWHHVVGSLSPAGMQFHVDGQLVGTNPAVVSAESKDGYWRIGGDTSWATGLDWFGGQIDEVAVYPRALSTAQITEHHLAATSGGPSNTAPTAAFTSSVSGLAVSVDGSSSADAEGPVASYAWDFGNGSTGTGARASHTYAAAGTYPVRLTVTDAAGATGTVTRSVTVTAPPAPPAVGAVATDTFGREVTGAWGTADLGGTWTVTGASANATVTGGSGRISAAAGGTSAATLPVSVRDVDVRSDVVVERAPTGGGSYVSLVGRIVGSDRYTTQLRFSATGSVTASLTKVAGGTETVLGSYRMPSNYTPGSALKVRFAAEGAGPTTLRAKVWAAGTTEPTGWQVTATDATAALQQAGAVRLDLFQSSTATAAQTVRLDDLQVVQPGATPPPANAAPTAAFTSSVSGLAVSVDGSSSTDAEGPVASYAWDFGNGSTGTGARASHTYAAAGTYPVRLTVTDAAGATATVTRSVTVTAPTAPELPANTAPTAAFTSSVSGLAVSVDGSSSADAEGPVASYAWDFGNGSTATGARASHTYAAAGTYPVKLTVTDAAGATGTVTRSVTVTAPPAPEQPVDTALARDAFGRAVAGGWGTADRGGIWAVGGTAANATVADGSGRLTAAAGAGTNAGLPVSVQDVAIQAGVLLERAPTGGGSYVSLVGRNVGSSTRYGAQLRFSATGSVTATLLRTVNGTETALGSYRLAGTYAPGTVLAVRFETQGAGTTTLRAKVWAAGSAEPGDWQVSATDATAALQQAGTVRIDLYHSANATSAQTLRVDDVWVGAAGTKP
ncbi:PKD domain-containing protein [Geodermatophilus sp. DSM 45219]|uniref:PKD domain-containing protein n=1 Tax=Geodermatophilus sp. DSM 45219 TaxID=1881103 RepID=UPI0008862B3E|nr:PKD domain-containing protein [Geodermatophilus sp. DSM 45219]SDN45394.1 PKD repeat-containing protein [Geodermatophilus sp. DSM 45219]